MTSRKKPQTTIQVSVDLTFSNTERKNCHHASRQHQVRYSSHRIFADRMSENPRLKIPDDDSLFASLFCLCGIDDTVTSIFFQ
jgi:hypothetical protein